MRLLSVFFVFICMQSVLFAEEVPQKKILIVVSNLKDMGDTEQHDARNNLWEVAPPYHIFVSHGYSVDFVSPEGGPVYFSMDPIGISSYTIKHENFLLKANASLTADQIITEDYAGVFIGGGYGALFDVATNDSLLSLMAKIYEAGGIVGGCGHGPGGFANVKLSTGEYMVKGRRVAGFPNSTERSKSWAKEGSLLPFLVEDRLRENGAIALNKTLLADKHEVVIDQGIVSTMFLPSAALVAKEMINLIEK
jgi:putative intracellular protease/amidase